MVCSLFDAKPLSEPMLGCLGDNDRAANVLFVQHPRDQGERRRQNPYVIIRPAPEGAGRATPDQTGHYSHYNAKLEFFIMKVRWDNMESEVFF